ncbi:hypothetical protein [Nonomuraea candida]|uniref:hypothetical protein n=1 Tax=Nonomuraea candida TaxID=359159 RepID=UPI0012F91A9A|nr:hypothetical protein [Nonomuraea candida]
MLKTSRLALAVSFSAVVLCGCGGAAESAGTVTAASQSQSQSQSASPAAAKDKRHQFEAAKADCMKQKGFKYVPYVKPTEPADEEERKRDSGDYQAMKKHRAKYGFGVFASQAYPKEVMGPGTTMPHPDPNIKIAGSLSRAQLEAYHKAKDACVAAAGKEVLGLTIKSNIDYFSQVTLAHKRVKAAELDGDPKLVELAGAMATCLKGKGYKVSDTKPTAMGKRGVNEFLDLQDRLAEQQEGDKPMGPKMTKDTKQVQMVPLTPQQAKPYMDREVKAALDDLECGKDFYAAFIPRETALQRQVNDQFAF